MKDLKQIEEIRKQIQIEKSNLKCNESTNKTIEALEQKLRELGCGSKRINS